MYIKFKRSLRGDYGRARSGDVKMVEPEVGKSLISRDLAVEATDAEAKAADKAAADQAKKGGGKSGAEAKAAE